jgi:hypothetical protein
VELTSAYLSALPSETSEIVVGLRTLAEGAGDPDALLLAPTPALVQAEARGAWGPSRRLRLGIAGTWERQSFETPRTRLRFGPDLFLVSASGSDRLTLGYREELGVLAGRFLSLGYHRRLGHRTRLDLRSSLSWLAPPSTGRYPVLEGGGAGYLTADLWRHLSLRVGLEARAGDHGVGWAAHLAVTGRL